MKVLELLQHKPIVIVACISSVLLFLMSIVNTYMGLLNNNNPTLSVGIMGCIIFGVFAFINMKTLKKIKKEA